MTQTAGGDVKAGEENRVIAKVHEIACSHRPGAGADVSQDDTYTNQQANLSPGTAKLLRVSKAKKRARSHDARW